MVNIPSRDPDTGAEMVSTRKLKPGFFPQFREIELETAKLNSVHDKDKNNQDYGVTTLKFFKADGTELVNPDQATLDAQCHRTEAHIMAPSEWGIRSASIRQLAIPSSPFYFWTDLFVETGLPDPYPSHTTIPYCDGGINLEFQAIRESVGVADENYSYFPAGTGMIWYFDHGVGVKHRLRMLFEVAFPLPGE